MVHYTILPSKLNTPLPIQLGRPPIHPLLNTTLQLGRPGDDDAKHFDGVYYDDEPLDHGFYQPGDSGGAKTPVKPAVKSTPAPVIQKFATPKKPNVLPKTPLKGTLNPL